MRTKIGVIGPQDSVNKVLDFEKEFDESAELMPYVYEVKSGTIELTERCQDEADLVLYTGEGPYQIAALAGVIRKPALFLPRNGSCIHKALWEMRTDGIRIRRLSTEVLTRDEVFETIAELRIPDFDEVFSYDLHSDFNVGYEELAAFHARLYDEGKIDAILTGFSRIFTILRERNIPVYKVFPTRSLIREYLRKALLMGEMKISKDAQVAVQLVKIRDPKGSSSSEYEFMARRNKLESFLIQYTRDNLGSLFPMGRDEYLIFTNRGAIENTYRLWNFNTSLFREKNPRTILSSGVGFGNSVYEAEKNARSALSSAIQRDYHCVFIIDEGGTISGPYAEEEDTRLSYSLSSGKDEKIREMSEATNLSPMYIAKLRALIEKNNRRQFDAPTVADYLNISVRSARRILTDLATSGYAKLLYTESKAKTGRPSHIYEISL